MSRSQVGKKGEPSHSRSYFEGSELTGTMSGPEDHPPSSPEKASLELHANVYTFAHRFLIDDIARLAAKCLHTCVKAHTDAPLETLKKPSAA